MTLTQEQKNLFVRYLVVAHAHRIAKDLLQKDFPDFAAAVEELKAECQRQSPPNMGAVQLPTDVHFRVGAAFADSRTDTYYELRGKPIVLNPYDGEKLKGRLEALGAISDHRPWDHGWTFYVPEEQRRAAYELIFTELGMMG